MPSSSGYTSHLSAEAVAFTLALPKAKQRKALRLAEQLSQTPHLSGYFQSEDAKGRRIENSLLDEFHFTYWIDHAVKEVRVTEITLL